MRDPKVTLEEFIEYYNNVSPGIKDDQLFMGIVSSAYRLYTPEDQSQQLYGQQHG
jgi:hypothetical protein